jgi:hypothetical protein
VLPSVVSETVPDGVDIDPLNAPPTGTVTIRVMFDVWLSAPLVAVMVSG